VTAVQGSVEVVWIIVLNWNGARDTIACVESCRALQYPARRILVVDNGSHDGSEDVLRDRWPDVDFLQTGANLGYAGGNNAGIRYALARGAAHVWLLNNDARVAPDCLTHLVESVERDSRVGIAGSKVYYLDRPTVLWSAGATLDLEAGGAVRHIGGNREDDGAHDAPASVDYVPGCSLMVRRETLAAIGLLDEQYFLYFEDADFCYRARRAGWTVRYEPRAKVWHREGSRKDGLYSATFIYYFLRNRLYLVRRFAPGRMWRCHWQQLQLVVFLLLTAAVRRGPRALVSVARLATRAYLDFYVHRAMGPERRGRIPGPWPGQPHLGRGDPLSTREVR
jgi:GT2 family glycosyltransferase